MRLYLLVIALLPFSALAQARLNLNFEPEANRHQPLLLWVSRYQGSGTQESQLLRVDTLTNAASGRGSLLLDASRLDEPVSGALYTSIAPVDSMRGHTVTISARMRTEGYSGKAFLYAHAQTERARENLASNDNFNTPAPPNTAGWHRVQIQLPVPSAATSLLFGLRFAGQGKVWLDDIQVEWDKGQRYHDQLLPGTEPLVLSAAARRPNWDFERPRPLLPDPRYLAQPDSTVPAHRGRRSLRLRPSAGSAAPFAYLGQVPVDTTLRGKTLVVQGYIRGATSPAASVYYTLLNEDNSSSRRRGARSGLRELPLTLASAADWQPFSVSLPITWNDYFTQVAIGMRLGNSGELWVDDMRLLVDGKPYVPPADPAAIAAPTAAELAWLRQAALPLRTVVTDGGDGKDLAAFGALTSKAQLIALGEVTYGSREVAQLRHRLARYLVEQRGVRALALEADMGACLALNAYLQTGQGDPRQLLGQLGTYNSAETLALVQWLRTFNERATNKVQVWGLECQHPTEAIAGLRQLLPPRWVELQTQLDQLTAQLRELPTAGIRLNPFTAPSTTEPRLVAIQNTLRNIRYSVEEHNRLRAGSELTLGDATLLRQLIQELEQYTTFLTLDPDLAQAYRAASLAENIYWCRSQQPGSKLLLLAHNNVVAATGTTGQLLRATYGPEFVTLGTAFGIGSFRTDDGLGGKFAVAQAPAPALGSYEHYFQTAKLPLSYLDLRTPPLSPSTQWLYQNLLLRDVGHAAPATPFLRHDLRREFDVLVFIPASTPLQAVR
ncbi:erythromycin esterase family protein [Hymenobacter fodinae]|uniref:Erythromycin esterase family protein n=1 Tax=Hymenobacter fodinae TaxID=2510796 RepID=A0A4Z0P6R9_9BACT|nr:erythromycin esterase family protein [Hymenobacter fodinae]TGE06367.1 erythromycin esterase family protein [Hymenobacter fodinae]